MKLILNIIALAIFVGFMWGLNYALRSQSVDFIVGFASGVMLIVVMLWINVKLEDRADGSPPPKTLKDWSNRMRRL